MRNVGGKLGWVFVTATLLAGCGASQEQPRGVVMGRFLSDEQIAQVEQCRTTERELLDNFGPPNSQGGRGSMRMLQWMAAGAAATSGQAVVANQSVIAWIDPEGLVALLSVNTYALSPAKPCSKQTAEEMTPPAPPPAAPSAAAPSGESAHMGPPRGL